MAEFRWDDDLYRYQPRVTEVGQWRIGQYIAARTVAWGAWVAYLLPLFLAMRLGGAAPMRAFLWAAAGAAGAAYLTANFLAPETPARGWARLLADEARQWIRAMAHRRPRPAHVTTARVRRHQETP